MSLLTLTDDIIAYEAGELTEDEALDLFQNLCDTGLISQLQGSYQRQAQNLLNQGLITVGGC